MENASVGFARFWIEDAMAPSPDMHYLKSSILPVWSLPSAAHLIKAGVDNCLA